MRILCLDIGAKRIGVAVADSSVRIALPRPAILVGDSADSEVMAQITTVFQQEKAETLVLGLPRNNSGAETRQTTYVKNFAAKLTEYLKTQNLEPRILFQDESWTSEVAKDQLKASKGQLSRADRDAGLVDSEAAAVILQDYLEGHQNA